MSNAIERIRGYCTEVTQAQWEELLRIVKGHRELYHGLIIKTEAELNKKGFGFAYVHGSFLQCESRKLSMFQNPIPFPDFLAKLRGVEEWTPKAGEMVEVRNGPKEEWYPVYFVGRIDEWNVCRVVANDYSDYIDEHIRPILPTITRAEAEAQLGKRIID